MVLSQIISLTASDWLQLGGFLLATIMLALTLVGGYAYFRSVFQKVQSSEAEKLVRTRGERIEDLEAEVENKDQIIQRHEGRIEDLQNLVTDTIALRIVDYLVERKDEWQ